MKHLYNEFVENFLFEQKLLNVIRKPSASPGARVEGAKSHPNMAPDEIVKPTIKDAKDRIARIRRIMIFNTKTPTAQKRRLTRRLRKLEKRLNRAGNRHKNNEAKKHEVALKTYKRLKLVMDKFDIKPKKKLVTKEDLDARAALKRAAKEKHGPEPGTKPKEKSTRKKVQQSAIHMPEGISAPVPLVSRKEKPAAKETTSKFPVLIGDLVQHKIKLLDSHLIAMEERNMKVLKLAPYQTRTSSEYREISKAVRSAKGEMKKIEGSNKSPKEKETAYKKINDELKKVALKFNVEIVPHKPPTSKDVMALVKKIRGKLSKIKDVKKRKRIENSLKRTELLVVKIVKLKKSAQFKQSMITDEYNRLNKWIQASGLEDPPPLSLGRQVDGKITYLEKYLKNKRLNSSWIKPSHKFVMGLKSAKAIKYQKAYKKLQEAKAGFEKALTMKEPMKSTILKLINSKLDSAVKSEGLKFPKKLLKASTPTTATEVKVGAEKLVNATPEQIVKHKMNHIREVHEKYLKILKNKKYPKNSKEAREKDNSQKVMLASIVSGFEKQYKAALAEGNPQARGKKFKKLNTNIDNMVVLINKQAKGKFEIKFPPMKGVKQAGKPGTSPKEKPVYLTGGARLKPNEIKGNYKDLILRLQKLESGRFKDRGKILERIARDANAFKSGAKTDQVSTHSLPDGYRIAAINWNKDYGHMVDRVVYRRGKVVCLRKKGVWYSHDEMPAFTRTANVIKSHSVVSDCTKRLAKVGDKNNETVRFNNTAELAAFKQSLIDWAKYGNMSKMSTTTHSPALTRGNVQVFYKRRGPGSGEFMIKIQTEGLGKRTIFFDTDTGKLGLATYKGVSGGKSELVSNGYEKGMVAMNKKEEAANLKKKNEAKAQKNVLKDQQAMKSNVNADFQKAGIAKFKKNPKNGFEFTIEADLKKPKHKELMKKRINQLVNLKDMTHRFAIFVIKGAKGKSPRRALFVPGQKTAYLVDKNGKMTNKRAPFYSGDTITVDYKNPTSKEFGMISGGIKKKFEKFRKKSKLAVNVRKVAYLKKKLLEFAKKKNAKATHPLAMKLSAEYRTAYNKLKGAGDQLARAKDTYNLASKTKIVDSVDNRIKAEMNAMSKKHKVKFKTTF